MNYSKDEMLFVKVKGDLVEVGLSKKAQDELGSITFVSFPKVGSFVKIDESFVEVEAEKAVNELVAPISGIVSAVNEEALNNAAILDNPEEGSAWLVRFSDVSTKDLENL